MAENACVITPAAPEWLSKLEDRREQRKHSKLGHELGSGAPCSVCIDKCPGLDLHFWRKVCRNCKCRKDQHVCADDDNPGWAQFEILGQIRSKPAYIKIKALACQPVHLEWVPPNVAPDVISDYMDKLGTSNIPVSGSEAALKRKQQLVYQVPPHDIDATLCDNLTATEAQQLQQYVQKIHDNCIGQGNVVRINKSGLRATIGHIYEHNVVEDDQPFDPEYVQMMANLNEMPRADPILYELLKSPDVREILRDDNNTQLSKPVTAFAELLTSGHATIEDNMKMARDMKIQVNSNTLSKPVLRSLVHNGSVYDKILAILKRKQFDSTSIPKLDVIVDFRKEYLGNKPFQREVDDILQTGDTPNYQNTTPSSELVFNSPSSAKYPVSRVQHARQAFQETPMRKIQFSSPVGVVRQCGLPTNIDYERDKVFARIINAEPLKSALETCKSNLPVIIEQHLCEPDFTETPTMTAPTRQLLTTLGVDSKALQSYIMNEPFYEALLHTLQSKAINYDQCRLLEPMKQLSKHCKLSTALYDELRDCVFQMANSFDVSYYGYCQDDVRGALSKSKSNDSGFESKPPTPSYALHQPGTELKANAAKFATIPGITDMKMFPTVAASAAGASALPDEFQNLQLSVDNFNEQKAVALHKCHDCSEVIQFGDIAVIAERAAKDVAWHPACFKCHSCRELLADLVYFYHGGEVYCGRDLAIKLKIPRCKACDELIFTKEYTAAENATYHIKHFCCYHCDTPLAGHQYIPDDTSNMPLCLKCYDDFFAVNCQRCQLSIGPTDQGVSFQELHWHHKCFLCAGLNCNNSLIGGRFCIKQNLPFCSPNCVRSVVV